MGARRANEVLVVGLVVASTGCKAPPEAPTELNELSAYLFRNYEAEDDRVLPLGLANLYEFFEDVDLDVKYGDRSYSLTPLTEDDIDVPHPDRDLSLAMPIAQVVASEFTPEEHATVMVLEDQTMVEPASPEQYTREFLDPEDPTCFLTRDCPVIRTLCDIRKQNAIMDLPYLMHKDFQWVEMCEPGSEEWAILARAWVEDHVEGSGGDVHMHQSFSIDVFLRDGDDGVIRYLALWTEVEIPGVGDSSIAGTTKYGMHKMFKATDDYLEDNL